MAVSLEKKLEEATVAKKRYRSLFVLASVALVLVLGIVYNNVVLDYAVLDNVTITRQAGTNSVKFQFDVIKPGRIDFNYGQAVLTDRKQVREGDGFNWSWTATRDTEVSVRSRQFIFPHWDSETFNF